MHTLPGFKAKKDRERERKSFLEDREGGGVEGLSVLLIERERKTERETRQRRNQYYEWVHRKVGFFWKIKTSTRLLYKRPLMLRSACFDAN